MPIFALMNQYAVLFDMDGVICNTNPYHVKAFEAFFQRHNISYTEQDFEDHVHGKHNSHIMSHFFQRPVSGEEFIRLEFEKEQLFRDIYKDQVACIPQFDRFLEDLKKHNFRTAVCTSAPRANMDLIVDALGIRSKMESLMSSEDVKLHKPHPEVYLQSAERIDVPPSRCLVFEDSASGITAGLNAGMKVIAVLSTHRKEQLPRCDYYIHDYSEITVDKVLEILND